MIEECPDLNSGIGNEQKAEQKVLTKINERLEYENKSLEFFGLPKLQKVNTIPALILEEMSYDSDDMEIKKSERIIICAC